MTPGAGPIAVSLPDLPEISVDGVVLANELLDNLPFALAVLAADGWSEVWVTTAEGVGAEGLGAEAPATRSSKWWCPPVPEWPTSRRPWLPRRSSVPVFRCSSGRPPGWRPPWIAWTTGRVVAFDYVRATAEMASLDQAASGCGPTPATRGAASPSTTPARRTSRRTSPSTNSPGCGRRPPCGRRPTSSPPTASRRWSSRAAPSGPSRAGVGDLAALRARSRVREAEALTDPSGLGAFAVLEWEVG